MKTETIMPKFDSYRKFKPEWKYEKKCCKECDKEYITDNMMAVKRGSYTFIWYCIRCYNLAPLNEGGMVNTNRMVDEFLVALGA